MTFKVTLNECNVKVILHMKNLSFDTHKKQVRSVKGRCDVLHFVGVSDDSGRAAAVRTRLQKADVCPSIHPFSSTNLGSGRGGNRSHSP